MKLDKQTQSFMEQNKLLASWVKYLLCILPPEVAGALLVGIGKQ
jgi:hypothetical protein